MDLRAGEMTTDKRMTGMAQTNSTSALAQADKTASDCMPRPPVSEIIARRISRRQALGGIAAAGLLSLTTAKPAFGQARSSLNFTEIAHGYDTNFHVPKEHQPQILIRWGDPLFPDAPAFDPLRQTATAQSRQFGYNNDFVAFLPLPHPAGRADHGLLCVNHEFTNADLMFPEIANDAGEPVLSAEQVDTEMAAHGHSIIEIRQRGGKWETVLDSPFNRRITTLETEMHLTGPAAGHARLKTAADPEGRKVIGTLNNCAGGVTPWGTVLIAEENFHAYFAGDPDRTAEAENHKQYGMRNKPRFQWGRYHDRFDLEKTPNEPNR
ncbi:MAG TPA: dTDP-glucose 4,6-dehydratase, partial [Alphaproteobacteria bacterium]|nr:dTDP-glucose 4,6-dehydratase [Alphaproteobacteria bacterium]